MKKKALAILIILLLVLTIFPVGAMAAAPNPIIADGIYDLDATNNNSILTINPGLTVELTNTGNLTLTNIVIVCGAGTNLTIDGVIIDNETNNGNTPAIVFDGADNVLNLKGINTLTGDLSWQAILVDAVSNGELTINGPGTLNANGGNFAAGIGGNGFGQDCGAITIESGTIIANGGDDAAGIGGGVDGDGGVITINGGTVVANGGRVAAGIGGGYNGNGGIITINGGEILAIGGTYIGEGFFGGAGIGSGAAIEPDSTTGGIVNISGGEVAAYGGIASAGIGGGMDSGGAVVDISGGLVYAAAGNSVQPLVTGVPDIGRGYDSGEGGLTPGSLAISGDAAVFLENNTTVTPVNTTTHTNYLEVYTSGFLVYGITTPNTWEFTGEWLRLFTLNYDANGGAGTVPAERMQHMGTKIVSPVPSGITRDGYTISGWNILADGSGDSFTPGDEYTFLADTVLYAQWTTEVPNPKTGEPDLGSWWIGALVISLVALSFCGAQILRKKHI